MYSATDQLEICSRRSQDKPRSRLWAQTSSICGFRTTHSMSSLSALSKNKVSTATKLELILSKLKPTRQLGQSSTQANILSFYSVNKTTKVICMHVLIMTMAIFTLVSSAKKKKKK